MASPNLDDRDLRTIGTCLRVVADGDVLLDDPEFPTVVGFPFATVARIAAAWPEVDRDDPEVRRVVHGALGNLLGYPHAFHDRWDERIGIPKDEVDRVFRAWIER